MSSSVSFKSWHPARFTMGWDCASKASETYAVVIINQTLENKDLLVKLCAGASIIACADGGANRLKDVSLSEQEEKVCLPHFICGDMDSLRPEVEEYYQDLGTKIVKNPDQYSTDVAKCLAYIDEHDIGKSADGPRASHRYPRDVAILGGLGGRADQAFSLLHQLYRTSQDQATDRDLYLIAPESIIFLLEKGLNSIETPTGPDLLTKYVGIIPIARPSVITTRGLEWDVVDWHTEFGTQVSTSNHIVEKLVEVQTTEKVLFTVELAGRACRES